MNSSPVKSRRHSILGKLFISAQQNGINENDLRDIIAPELIGKRLSAASEKEISIVLEHVAGPSRRRAPRRQYPSSMQGLRQEIVDMAKERWGDGWPGSLISLCRKFGVDHYNFLDMSHAKAIKAAILRFSNQQSTIDNQQSEEVPF